jgi:hypothetical protein
MLFGYAYLINIWWWDMPNIIDYVTWRGDLTLGQSALNDVDCLCLSQLAYMDFKGIVPERRAHGFGDAVITVREAAVSLLSRGREPCTGILMPKCNGKMLRLMARSRRFGHMRLSGFCACRDERRHGQFGAILVHTGNGACFVAFCGTDDSIVGWKEDLDLVCKCRIPSQERALAYLTEVAKNCGERLLVGGHSKGGNLGVYAAANLNAGLKDRVAAVYNYDGPYDYAHMKGGVCEKCGITYKTFVPDTSFVGVILGEPPDCVVVKSSEAGVWQHNPYSWQVEGCGFVRAAALSWESHVLSRACARWLRHMGLAQREQVVGWIYGIFSKNGARTLTELLGKK